MHFRPLFLLIVLIPACGDEGITDSGVDYGCETPWEIVLYNQNDIRSDCYDKEGKPCDRVGIALPSGVETTLVIGAVDAQKRPCDPSLLSASIDSEDFAILNDGNDLIVMPLKDTFDLGEQPDIGYIEPSATLTVTYGNLAARWQVMSAVNLAGTWEITVDDLTVGDFATTQSGRFIRWADCEPNDTSPMCSSGIIQGEEAILFSPLGSLKLGGWIWPSRDHLNGVWTDGANQGFWEAVKIPDP